MKRYFFDILAAILTVLCLLAVVSVWWIPAVYALERGIKYYTHFKTK